MEDSMRMTLSLALGAAWLAGAGAHPDPHRTTSTDRTTVDSTALARQLVGHWKGTRHEAGSAAGHRFTMSWKTASDGHLAGTVEPAAGPAYETNVVWSSDTGFVTESAPHRSPELNEEVVTRMVAHLKGDSLSGKFEMRPMTYRGRSAAGNFTAARQQ
jgi:hypothetical protein